MSQGRPWVRTLSICFLRVSASLPVCFGSARLFLFSLWFWQSGVVGDSRENHNLSTTHSKYCWDLGAISHRELRNAPSGIPRGMPVRALL
jgi:hypothetical protein